MEKDIDRITKNSETDIVIRIDDFGGRTGLTIREFVKSERYSGFTKAGTRIPADKFKQFKEAINSVDEKDLEGPSENNQEYSSGDSGENKENGNSSVSSAGKSTQKKTDEDFIKNKGEMVEGIEEQAI
jgi:hypothetical protein